MRMASHGIVHVGLDRKHEAAHQEYRVWLGFSLFSLAGRHCVVPHHGMHVEGFAGVPLGASFAGVPLVALLWEALLGECLWEGALTRLSAQRLQSPQFCFQEVLYQFYSLPSFRHPRGGCKTCK